MTGRTAGAALVFVLVAATVLALAHVIDGGQWLAFVGGLAVPTGYLATSTSGPPK